MALGGSPQASNEPRRTGIARPLGVAGRRGRWQIKISSAGNSFNEVRRTARGQINSTGFNDIDLLAWAAANQQKSGGWCTPDLITGQQTGVAVLRSSEMFGGGLHCHRGYALSRARLQGSGGFPSSAPVDMTLQATFLLSKGCPSGRHRPVRRTGLGGSSSVLKPLKSLCRCYTKIDARSNRSQQAQNTAQGFPLVEIVTPAAAPNTGNSAPNTQRHLRNSVALKD